jgi:STE24 endopeptidase
MKTPLIVVLCVYLGLQAFRYCLDWLNLRYMRRKDLPALPDLHGVLDREFLDRTRLYLSERTHFEMAVSGVSTAAVVLFLFCGLLDLYNSWIASLGLSFTVSGWLFFVLLSLAWELLALPFSLYSIFHIEQKYGFNTMTHRTWFLDFLKSGLLSLALLTAAAFGGLTLVEASPGFWWFWVWCFFLLLTVFITYIAPYVIEPLFNKFTPMEDGPLKEAIVSLASRAGINLGKVLKMDQSTRSRHSNAYFTGLGKTKRIILFDTLLESMKPDEVLAVLAHEIGHWKRRHLLKGLSLTGLVSLAFFFCVFQAMSRHLLDAPFGLRVASFPAEAVIAAFLASMLSFLLKPAMNGFSRRLEREADRFSCAFEGKGDALIGALVKLSKDNLSNFNPHPLYALFHYSHPPVLERIRQIKEYCGKNEGRPLS